MTTTDRTESQEFAALHAQCRAAGVDLMRGVDFKGEPVFIVSRWVQFKELPTLQAVANWLAWTTGKGTTDA